LRATSRTNPSRITVCSSSELVTTHGVSTVPQDPSADSDSAEGSDSEPEPEAGDDDETGPGSGSGEVVHEVSEDGLVAEGSGGVDDGVDVLDSGGVGSSDTESEDEPAEGEHEPEASGEAVAACEGETSPKHTPSAQQSPKIEAHPILTARRTRRPRCRSVA